MTGKILIVDDAKPNRDILRAILEQDYFSIIEATNGAEALKITAEELPDLILLDVNMPVMNGFETCRRLKSKIKTANIPVIMVTTAHRSEEKYEGLSAGADDFLPKPIEKDILFARVRNLLRVKQMMDELHLRGQTAHELGLITQTSQDFENGIHRLLIMAPSEETGDEWRRLIEAQSHFQIEVQTVEDAALARAGHDDIDAMIIAENLDEGGDGLRLVANLRTHWSNRNLVLLFVAQSGSQAGLRALELGANDYMTEPFDPIELTTRLRTQSKRVFFAKYLREQFNKQLRLSVIDPLTELHNRRYLDDYFPRLLKRAEREQMDIAVMFIDLDHFKSINDQYGHDFGDEVLAEFSRRTRENLRAADMIIRYGGEEFLVITPGVSREQAETISQRLCNLVANRPFITKTGEKVFVTASLGVTMVPPGESDIPAIFKRADDAVYRAKNKGRNQVNFAA